jgi:large subunit ribosomal protein L22
MMNDRTGKFSRASVKNLDVAPRKVRLMADMIRGMNVNEALAHLQTSSRRASKPIAKLLKSSMANAKVSGLDVNRLVVEGIAVDKGDVLKRRLPKGRGRVSLIEKKRSHVNLLLRESELPARPRFVFNEKPKDIKQKSARGTGRTKFREEKAPAEKKKGAGFVRRLFQRRSA